MESYNIVINESYEHLRPLITAIVKGQRPAEAEDIYRGRNTLYRTQLDGVDAVVKDFKTPNLLNRWVYTNLRQSKARRSYENAMKMMAAGFLSPEPIAYGEHKVNGQLRHSYYISRNLVGATEMRHWKNFGCIDTLLPAFAAEMLRLHKAGIYHRDFSPGNILFTGDAEHGYRFHYVDLNRINFDVHNPRILNRMFRAIQWPDLDETRHLARLYADAAGKDPQAMEAIATDEYNGYKRSLEFRTALKNIFRKKK
ncbi:MAG: LPS kinase Kdo/WaaP [Bacteroides sp.]|nr:LPS kinase Kdo/WaaP [Bacteroides sp.]